MVWESCHLFMPRTGFTPVQSFEIFLTLFLFVAIISLCFSPGGLAWSLSKSRLLQQTNKTRTAIPGPSGLPILGSVFAFTGSSTHRALAELAGAHGAKQLMAFSVGFTRFVVSSHPETAKELLNSSAFADRPVKESAYELLFHRAMGFAPFGDYWRSLRRISAAHLFGPKRIASFGGFRRDIGLEMVGEMEGMMERSGEVEVRKVLHLGSLNNVMMSVFGRRYGFEFGHEGVELDELDELVKEGYDLLGVFNWSDHFPLLGVLDLQGVRRRGLKIRLK